jgi:cell wall-associated NlpC family hydrolase
MAVAGRALVALLILGAFAGVGVVVDTHSATASSTQAQLIVSDAASQTGVPYCDGGGGINGPSNGGVVETGCGAGVKGFDCMSLVQYAVYQATGIILPSNGTQPEGVGTYIAPAATLAEDEAQVLPGDAVYWGGSGIDGFAHSGIYAGNDEVWDAVGPGIYVQTHTFEYLRETYNYDGAEQYTSNTSGTLAITTTSLPNGSVYSKSNKVTYSATLAASGGNPPYRWTRAAGSNPLPPGLHLYSATGIIKGRITATGTYSFTITVHDTKTTTKPKVQHSASKTLSITVS